MIKCDYELQKQPVECFECDWHLIQLGCNVEMLIAKRLWQMKMKLRRAEVKQG